MNWRLSDTLDQTETIDSFNVTIRARIAGKTTPSSAYANCLEVIEIPISKQIGHSNDSDEYESTSSSAAAAVSSSTKPVAPINFSPHQLAVCQASGTLIFAINHTIKLHKFNECTNDSSHFKYIDFMELPFEIELDFIPIYLCINEHIVGCGNREFMCIFKLLERSCLNAIDSDDMLSANSLTTSSELSGINVASATYAISDENRFENGKKVNEFDSGENSHSFDFRNASRKHLSSITANISSNFEQISNEFLNGKSKCDPKCGSGEFRPIFVENGIPMGAIKYLPKNYSMLSDEVSN